MMLNSNFSKQGTVLSTPANLALLTELLGAKELVTVAAATRAAYSSANKSVVSQGAAYFSEAMTSSLEQSVLPEEIFVTSDPKKHLGSKSTVNNERERGTLKITALKVGEAEEDSARSKTQQSTKRKRAFDENATTSNKKERTGSWFESGCGAAVTSTPAADSVVEKASIIAMPHETSEEHQPAAASPVSGHKKKYKKPKDMPRRPLSAYNIFFREERARILPELMRGSELSKGAKVADQHIESRKTTKAESHSGLFSQLGKTIGARWNSLSPSQKHKYRSLAAIEMSRYRMEMIEYNARRSAKALTEEDGADYEELILDEDRRKNHKASKKHFLMSGKATNPLYSEPDHGRQPCGPTSIDLTSRIAATNARIQANMLNLLSAQQNAANMEYFFQNFQGLKQDTAASNNASFELLESLAKNKNPTSSQSTSSTRVEEIVSGSYSANGLLSELSNAMPSSYHRAILNTQNGLPTVGSYMSERQPLLESKVIDPLSQMRLVSLAAEEVRTSYIGRIKRMIEEQRQAQTSMEQLISNISAEKERELFLQAQLILQERVRQHSNQNQFPRKF